MTLFQGIYELYIPEKIQYVVSLSHTHPTEERKQIGTKSYYPHFTSTVIHLKNHVVTNSKMICVGFDEIDSILSKLVSLNVLMYDPCDFAEPTDDPR